MRSVSVPCYRQNRLFQHGLVKFKPKLFDMAGLFFTDQIAGAAQVKVITRKVKPGTEAVERLHNLQRFSAASVNPLVSL